MINRADLPPLIVFVHIPKCGGTSVRNFLERACMIGMHTSDQLAPSMRTDVTSSVWAAGHTPISEWITHFDHMPFEAFSTVRDPRDRVISHINMLVSFVRSGVLENLFHGSPIRTLARKLADADWDSPRTIRDILAKQVSISFITAARFLCGKDVNARISDDQICAALSRFSYVGTAQSIPALCGALGFFSDDELAALGTDIWHKNAGSYAINRALFDEPELITLFEEQAQLDQRVIAQVQQFFVDPPVKSHDRSALRHIEPAHFDEAVYFEHNPDVADAVRSGTMPSGYFHFIHHGRQEGRAWPFPV